VTADRDGILCIDKEPGWTSHDVVAKVRRLTGQRKAGHTGTLDPAATGLLVVCLGRATRVIEYMSGHDKEYSGIVRLGFTTDSDDAEGQVITTALVPPLGDADLRSLEQQFTGRLEQRPPAFSAVHVGGQRAYRVARAGGAPDIEPRPVRIDEMRVELLEPGLLGIHVVCGPGTYVRSLARDIGAALGCGAHLASLKRLRSGPFSLATALTLQEMAQAVEEGRLEEWLAPADEGLLDRDAVIISKEHEATLADGQAVRCAPVRPAEVARIYGAGGGFLGVARVEPGQIRPKKVLFLPK
jgi:tRNA pseudouridine55 synthase